MSVSVIDVFQKPFQYNVCDMPVSVIDVFQKPFQYKVCDRCERIVEMLSHLKIDLGVFQFKLDKKVEARRFLDKIVRVQKKERATRGMMCYHEKLPWKF